MITITIPTIMRPQVGGAGSVEVEAGTVLEALGAMEARHPGSTARILADGQVRSFINVYVGDEDIRGAQGLDTPVADGSTLSIIPAVAGG